MRFIRLTAIILIFVFLGLLLIHNLGSINQDIGRHLKSGQIIWEAKSVYKTNLFSFTEPEHPFINHHWLSEVIFFLLNGWVGLKGLIIFKTLTVAASFGLIFATLRKKTNPLALSLGLLIGALVMIDRTDVRPEIFSYLSLSFFLWAILKTREENNDRWLLWLPLAQVFWTNAHIYFILGPALLLALLIDRMVHRQYNSRFLLIFLLTIAATLLNPNFIQGALLPFNILRDYGYTVVENQSVSFLTDYGLLLKQINIFEFSLVMLGLSFILVLKNGEKKIAFSLLTALLGSVLALKMIRNFGIYALLFIPVFSLNFSSALEKIKPKKEMLAQLILGLCLVFLISQTVTGNLYRWLESDRTFGLTIPAGASKGVEFVQANKIAGPVFNNFDVGSFLIWKLYPEQKVFMDGRPEAYSVDFIENVYKGMQQDPTLWKKYSEQYGINYIFFDYHDITPWAKAFLQNISVHPLWAPVYLDSSVVIFLKKVPQNEELIKHFSLPKISS